MHDWRPCLKCKSTEMRVFPGRKINGVIVFIYLAHVFEENSKVRSESALMHSRQFLLGLPNPNGQDIVSRQISLVMHSLRASEINII